MPSAGFAISIKLLDLATGPLGKINAAIANIEKTASRAARQGGLFEARDALSKMRREASEVSDKLGTIFTPFGGLTAAGSLAGLTALAQNFARVGTEIGRTSQLFGVGTKDLQNWRGAMRLAGGSAEEATGLIGAVGRQLYLARAGLNPNVVLGAQQFGLDITKGDLPFILDAADKLKGLSAQQRRQFAQVFGIDENSLVLLSQGRAAIEQLTRQSEQHGHLSDEQLRQSFELRHAYVGLEQSIESMSGAIGAQMSQWLTPMLVKWSDWLDLARQSPATMKAIELGVDALAIAMGTTLVGSLGRVLWWSNKIWALPLFKFLASRGGGALLGGLGGAAAVVGAGIFAPDSILPQGVPALRGGAFDWVRRGINRLFTGAAPGHEKLPGGRANRAGGSGGGYSLGQMKQLALNAGFVGADADKMAAIAMVESSGNPGAEGAVGELGLTQVNPHAWGQDLANQARDPQRAFEIAKMIKDKQGWGAWQNSLAGAQQYLDAGGIKAEPLSSGNTGASSSAGPVGAIGSGAPAALLAYGDSIAVGVKGAGNLGGVAVGGKTTDWVLNTLKANSDRLRGQHVILSTGASNDLAPGGPGWRPEIIRQQLDVLKAQGAKAIVLGVGAGVRNNQEINKELGGISKEYGVPFTGELETTRRRGGVVHPTEEGYGQVLEHARQLDKQAEPYSQPTKTPDKGADAGSDDISHHVEVHIANAPAGTRARVTHADGPASIAVHTRYAA